MSDSTNTGAPLAGGPGGASDVPRGTDDSGDGDCFVVAGMLACDAWLSGEQQVTLCHGVITGTGEIEGVPHWHAWVERPHVVKGDPFRTTVRYALDLSNGKRIAIPAAAYRALARPHRIWEYTPAQAAAWMRETGHYGPWQGDDGSVQ